MSYQDMNNSNSNNSNNNNSDNSSNSNNCNNSNNNNSNNSSNSNDNDSKKRKFTWRDFRYLCWFMFMILIIGFIVIYTTKGTDYEAEFITESSLKRILNVSELSTFEAVYNGIAKVENEENPEKIDFYVSYDAKVKAGIDFDKIDITVNKKEKTIFVVLPIVKINDVAVDISSLDFIFINDKANTETVTEIAYKKCIEDVEAECSREDAIYELAEENTKSIIEALLKPFIEQLDDDYNLVFQ